MVIDWQIMHYEIFPDLSKESFFDPTYQNYLYLAA